MLRYQNKFGLIRGKKKKEHLHTFRSVCPLRLPQKPRTQPPFPNLPFLFLSPQVGRKWREGAAERHGPTRCGRPLGESTPGNLGWNLQAPELRSRGTSLGRTESPRGQGLLTWARALSLQDTHCPSKPRRPSLSGWILCELPQRPWLALNHKFSPT